MAAEIPAGWYPNPWNDAEELYWSGTEWTGISRAVHQAASSSGAQTMAASEIEESTIMRPVGPAAGVQLGGGPFGGAPYGSAQPDAGPFHPAQPDGAQFGLAQPASAGPWDAPAYAPPQSVPPLPAAVPAPPTMPPVATPTPVAAPHSTAPYPEPAFPVPPAATAAYPYDGSASALPTGTVHTGTGPYASPGQDGASFTPQSYDAAAFPSDSADAATIRWALGGTPTPPATNPRARLGLVAMILGIVAAVFAIVPGLSFAAWVPAFVAIALGIIGYLGGKPRAFALAGIIAGGAALAVGTGVSIWFLIQLGQFGR